jgi:phospholipid/cholesterol/gamma-HCH transport system permease protein
MIGPTVEVPAAALERAGDVMTVALSGAWRLEDPRRPAWSAVEGGARCVVVVDRGLSRWDSSLALYLLEAGRWSARSGVELIVADLPQELQDLVRLAREAAAAPPAPTPGRRAFLASVGLEAEGLLANARVLADFVGECALSLLGALRRPWRLRLGDILRHVQEAGAEGLPIIGLVAFLVGTIIAFQAALQLRRFGAEIFLVNLVDLSVAREMGPLIVAVVLSGRTAAAFAAELGSMAANEELDALETAGISPVDFLVLPRLLALAFVTPLLTVYADALAILGGAAVASSMLDMPLATFYQASKQALGWSDLLMGLEKSAAFGVIVAVCGCLRGMNAERDTAGVGLAATSAVVTSILWIVVTDALFGKLFSLSSS